MSTQRKAKAQRSLWEGVVDVDVRALWEPWMVEADHLLEDEELIETVFEAQGQRHPFSATRGRAQTPAETALRLLLLKHVRNWSFDTLEREVSLNLAYRDFARIGLDKVPDAKTLARIAQAVGGEAIPYVCPAKAGVFSGSQPRQGNSQSPVAWMVGRKETESRETIDKAIPGMGSEPRKY